MKTACLSTSCQALAPGARALRAAGRRTSVRVRSVLPTRAVAEDVAGDKSTWTPDTWREYKAKQQPNYPDAQALKEAVEEIGAMPPLVFAGEARNLQAELAKAVTGDGFVLFGGDCAEAFSQFSANRIRDTYRVLLQMSVIMMFGGGLPVTKIGRMAGQFAKPRSADTETINGVELPSYRGDIINSAEFTPEARVPNPKNLVQAYHQSAATLNLLRGFSSGGYGGLDRVSDWNLDFMDASDEGNAYKELAGRVDEAVQFMKACGLNHQSMPIMQETDFYTAHEALLLDYESALTRLDSTTDQWYNCSAHFVWIGERTRELDGAHIKFFEGIKNPIGVKVSQKIDPDDLVRMCTTLNPNNTPGRLSIIVRMGAENVRDHLPTLLRAVTAAGLKVVWVCDPVHGNTESYGSYKTRRYERVRAEVEAFFDCHDEVGTVPGGVHLELTGDNVTECIGGGSNVSETDLSSRYHTHCDPRLNAEQALEMAFYVAKRLRQRKLRCAL